MSLVKLKNISKIYRSNGLNFPALDGISLDVLKGEFLSIAGPSGSGKTTILNIVGCLDTPSGGTFHLDDNDVGSKNSSQLADIRRHYLGFIFQTFQKSANIRMRSMR